MTNGAWLPGLEPLAKSLEAKGRLTTTNLAPAGPRSATRNPLRCKATAAASKVSAGAMINVLPIIASFNSSIRFGGGEGLSSRARKMAS